MVQIDSSFPGGNTILDGIEGDTVRLRQDQRDTRAYSWFYWYFRVRGAEGRRLRFVFQDPVIGVRGPGVSEDGGASWRWLGQGQLANDCTFTYSFPRDLPEARFSFGMPYTQADLERFLSAQPRAHLRAEPLCSSRKGRPVELLLFGRVDGEPEHRVLLTCRHHACEMMASYALEGFIEGALADDDTGRWLREHVAFLAVPFVDKDGVEDGDQGKGRDPHDHNRDYVARRYPEVRALQNRVSAWSQGCLRFALDLHCPGARGRGHELIHFVGVPQEDLWDRILRFCNQLEESNRGPLPYRTSNNLPFGTDWNTAEEYGSLDREPQCASDWLSRLPGVWFGATLEIPYANAQGAEVNGQTARAFGRDLAEAARRHLMAR